MESDREKKRVGRQGEDLACRYLMDAGHSILERNWRSGHLEVDIISMDRKGIHFVEVKTRRPPLQADPQDNVNYAKQKRLAEAAGSYLKRKDLDRMGGTECFFDIVSVIIDGENTRIEYFPEAFVPIYYGK